MCMCECGCGDICVVSVFTHTLGKVIEKYTHIVPEVFLDDPDCWCVSWCEGDVYNSLYVYVDEYTVEFNQHHSDGKLIRSWEGVLSIFRDEIICEWWENNTPYAFSVYPDDDMWLLVARSGGELVTLRRGTIY